MDSPITPAPWLAEMLRNIQASEDAHYTASGARAVFEQAKANWIAANTVNRDNNLPITPFTASVPQRKLFYPTSTFEWAERYEPDATATLPELPPAPKLQPPTQWSTSPADSSAQLNQVLGLILAKMVMLEKAVAALKAS